MFEAPLEQGWEWGTTLADLTDDWPAWISASTGLITLLIVGITAGFALMGLQDARRTRHGQLITDLTRDWTDAAVIEAHGLHGRYEEKDIVALVDTIFGPGGKKATPEELANWTKLARVANLIEALGVLASENAVTPQLVYKMWGGAILTAWPKWDEAVRRLREYDKEPDTFYYFEEISLKVQRIADERKQAREDAGITWASRARSEQAEAGPGKDVQKGPSGSNHTRSDGLYAWRFLAALLALSALVRWCYRRSSPS